MIDKRHGRQTLRSAGRVPAQCQYGIDADDLPQTFGDVSGGFVVEPANLDLDRQARPLGPTDGAMPQRWHEPALGEEFEYAGHRSRLGAGVNRKKSSIAEPGFSGGYGD
jgi:hypothetical protein